MECANLTQPVFGGEGGLLWSEQLRRGSDECRQLSFRHHRQVGTNRRLVSRRCIYELIHIPGLSTRQTEPLLTARFVPDKTESVSESVHKITGDCLRLQIFL